MFHNFRDIGGREHRRAAGSDGLDARLLCPPLERARSYLRQGSGFVKRVDERPLSHSAPDAEMAGGGALALRDLGLHHCHHHSGDLVGFLSG